eukprot:gene10459-3029_t
MAGPEALSAEALRPLVARPQLPVALDRDEFLAELEGCRAEHTTTLAAHIAHCHQKREKYGAAAGQALQRGVWWPAGDVSHGERWLLSISAENLAKVASSLLYVASRFGAQLGCTRVGGVWQVPIALSKDRTGPLAVLCREFARCLGEDSGEKMRFTAVVGDCLSPSVTFTAKRPAGACDWGYMSVLSAARLRALDARFAASPDATVQPGVAVVAADIPELRISGAQREVQRVDAVRVVCDAADKAAVAFAADPAQYASYQRAIDADGAGGGAAPPEARPAAPGGAPAAEPRTEQEQRRLKREEAQEVNWDSEDSDGVRRLGRKQWLELSLSQLKRKVRSPDAPAWGHEQERAEGPAAQRLEQFSERDLKELARLYRKDLGDGAWQAVSIAEAKERVPDGRRRRQDWEAMCEFADLCSAVNCVQRVVRELNLLPHQAEAAARQVLGDRDVQGAARRLYEGVDAERDSRLHDATWQRIFTDAVRAAQP